MWRCVNCGKENQSNRAHCWKCGTKEDGTPPENPESFTLPYERGSASGVVVGSLIKDEPQSSISSVGAVAESKEASSVMERYRNAYVYARFTVGVGEIIKVIGITLAVLFFLVLFATGSAIKTTPLISLFTGIIVGGSIGATFYIGGILVSAVGEILKASLDNAVNSSPFLEDSQRARIMSL
jgi:hypothetical protein